MGLEGKAKTDHEEEPGGMTMRNEEEPGGCFI